MCVRVRLRVRVRVTCVADKRRHLCMQPLMMQHTAALCNTLLHTATQRHTTQHSAPQTSFVHAAINDATHCNTLQHTATQTSCMHAAINGQRYRVVLPRLFPLSHPEHICVVYIYTYIYIFIYRLIGICDKTH